MRMFVFSMRTFDELPCFEKYCPKYGIEYDYTTETPCMDNLELAKGYDVVNVITTVFDQPMLKKLHDMGVKCIATRTIGYDHIDVDYAKSLGMGVIHISYSPNSVADYAIMMMLMGLRRMPHIMERANIQDYTLKGKIGRELPDCTVGIIGTGRIGRTVIRHLSGFGCKMLAYDLYENEEVKQYAEYTDLDTLLKNSEGLFYFGMLIPMSATEPGGYLLPVVYAVATGLPVVLVAWILAYSVAGIGKFYNRIQIFQKWFNRVVAALFIAVGIYYAYINYL